MTANIRLLIYKYSDLGSITATSEVAAMPSSNLQVRQPGRVWRSTSAAVQTLELDFGKSRPIRSIAIYNHNFSEDAEVRFQLSNESDFSVLLLDKTYAAFDPSYGYGEFPYGMVGYGGYSTEGLVLPYFVKWESLVVARYARVIITDTGNVDGYVQAGRLLVGDYFEPEWNVDYGAGITWVDPSVVTRTRSSSIRTQVKPKYRRMTGTLSLLSPAEAGKLLDYERTEGLGGDLLVSLYPEEGGTRERRNTFLGLLAEWSPTAHHNSGGYDHSFNFTIEELP